LLDFDDIAERLTRSPPSPKPASIGKHASRCRAIGLARNPIEDAADE
jgi:hypothetical protein